MPISSEQFAVLRRTNPAAAFSELMKDLSRAIKEDSEVAKAVAAFQTGIGKKIKFSVNARTLDALKAKGAANLGINVGSMPVALSAGLAFLYDEALEALRSSDVRIKPQMISPRAIHSAERLFDKFLAETSSKSVTALDLALSDEKYAQHLRQRAGELTTVGKLGGITFLDTSPDPGTGICEHCTIVVTDEDGKILDYSCPTEEQCAAMFDLLLLLLLIYLLWKLFDWLF